MSSTSLFCHFVYVYGFTRAQLRIWISANIRVTQNSIHNAIKYLALRFSKSVQVLGSVIFILQMILYMAVVLYAPAIALNQVMGIDLLVSILAIGLICTFYTAIGGLKAVMWTDAFQMVIVFAGVLAVAVKGMQEVGGFDVVWETAKNGSKLHADNFDPNPLERHTFWTLVLGGFVTSLTIYASNQAMIQRYLSMESVKRAQITLYLQLPGALVFTSLLVFTGMVLYAKYHDNDPVQECLVSKRDQLIPWLVMDILGQYHGFPGLMVACIFSASLSTVSSGVNALALVCLTDLLKPLYTKITKKSLGEKKLTIISKVLAVIFGLITIGLAFLAQMFGKLILQVTLSIFGMVGGPLLGLIICAMFVPMVNHWGALVGVVTSICITSWIAIGSIVYASGLSPPNPCDGPHNSTELNSTTYSTVDTSTVSSTHLYTTSVGDKSYDPLSTIYRLSYMWYSTLAVLVTVIVGILVSCFTGGTRKAPVDHRLLSPFYLAFSNMARVVNLEEIEETAKKMDEFDLDKNTKRKLRFMTR
ncbi:hypothetical protein ACJMK2_009873 [Sinanodonta woodiana]|uniref:Sodium-coupled monocarboxylate transporter 1 n=1 Tax=Sinanodonta woodiana TaxID=1069815 RepID=A0ABD3VDM6_SINWO